MCVCVLERVFKLNMQVLSMSSPTFVKDKIRMFLQAPMSGPLLNPGSNASPASSTAGADTDMCRRSRSTTAAVLGEGRGFVVDFWMVVKR